MKCPCCKTELVPWIMLKLETLDEHVTCCQDICEKQAYVCPNQVCQVNTRPTLKIFWNDIGDLYGEKDHTSTDSWRADNNYLNAIPWIDKNNAPFGTFQRKCNVEIYKQDENKDLFILPKWLPIRKGWRCEREWHYQSNEDGDILKRSSRLKWWIPNEHGTWTLYVSGFRMLRHVLREVWRHYVDLLKAENEKQEKWTVDKLQEVIKRSEWEDAEWWRYVGAFAAHCVLRLKNLVDG